MQNKEGHTNFVLLVSSRNDAGKLDVPVQNKEIRRHLLDMGLTRGTEIEIKKKAPVGDPIDIKLRDYELCISKSDSICCYLQNSVFYIFI